MLKTEWPKIEELLIKNISFRGRKLFVEGPLHLLESLSPDIDIYISESRAVMRRISKAEIRFAENDRLFLTPSYFIWPHLFVKRDKPVGINYPIIDSQNEGRRPTPPEQMLKFFRAMGDLPRLQILQSLAQKPRSTRELAGLIGITGSAVSKHLKQLQRAGAITCKRESYYVFYQLEDQLLAELSSKLLKYLE